MSRVDVNRILRYAIPGVVVLLVLVVLLLIFAARRDEMATDSRASPEKTPESTPAAPPAADTTAVTQAPAPPAAPVPGGIRIVYDASYSMCGFLNADKDNANADGLFARLASTLEARPSQQLNPAFLLVSRNSAGVLQPAPSDFHANRRSAGSSCVPFTALESYPNAIFAADEQGPPRSVLFITDGQFLGSARSAFVGAFESWYAERPADAVVSAGIVTFAAPFVGSYYPVGSGADEADGRRRKEGGGPRHFVVPRYDRLLNVIWFSSDAADTAYVQEVLGSLGALEDSAREHVLYRQQFIPLQSSNPAHWFTAVRQPGQFGDLLDVKALQIAGGASGRDARTLEDCVAAPVSRDDTLRIVLDGQCRDGKAFFETRKETLAVTLQLKPGLQHRVAYPQAPPGVAVSLPDERTLRLEFDGASPNRVELALAVAQVAQALDLARLSELSFGSEPCLFDQRQLADCVNTKLQRRTYQFDTLVRMFAVSAESVRLRRAGTLAASLPLKIALDAAATQ